MLLFSERLKKIIELQTGGNKKKFAKSTAIPYSTLVEYVNGIKKDPKLSMLAKIKNVNAEWLLYGSGDPQTSEPAGLKDQVDALITNFAKNDNRIDMLELKIDAMNMLLLKQAGAVTPKK